MNEFKLSSPDLLAGANATFDLTIPTEVLKPGLANQASQPAETQSVTVQLQPLTIGTFQLIMKAANQDAGLIPLLMIKESLVEPKLSLDQVRQMHLGLVNFLILHIRQISGLTVKKNPPDS
jgi:hypothetical protein